MKYQNPEFAAYGQAGRRNNFTMTSALPAELQR